MNQGLFEIIENQLLVKNVHRLRLAGDISAIETPGQFVQIQLDGHFLRRPFSVCDAENGILTVLYKSAGTGTNELAEYETGKKLKIFTGLGNGFSQEEAGESPLLVGGGIGMTPLYFLAKRLKEKEPGRNVRVILGFRSADEIFYSEEFEKLGCSVMLTAETGSTPSMKTVRGLVTDALPENYSFVYSCGPLPMMKSLAQKIKTSGEFSLEARMGCGFGACMGCSAETAEGPRRICRDGPIFRKEVLLWED